MKSSDEGIHSASIGGIWAVYVFGFGGVMIDKKRFKHQSMSAQRMGFFRVSTGL